MSLGALPAMKRLYWLVEIDGMGLLLGPDRWREQPVRALVDRQILIVSSAQTARWDTDLH
jgi:hypothetical protein